jgi:hypothetical protein
MDTRPTQTLSGVCIATVVGLFSTTVAFADTFTVDRTDDTASATACTAAANDCSLRGAILASNARGGNDTINIPAGTYKITIAGTDEDTAGTGDFDITDGTTTINGTGANASAVVIDGNGKDRVFDIFANAAISNLTIANGNGNQGGGFAGGGIITSANTLTLNNVIVTQNSAVGHGGGIVLDSGTATLTDVTVSNNSCLGTGCSGGAIFNNAGSLVLNRVTLSGNLAHGGGAIASDFDETLTNVTISGNTSNGLAAAIMHNGQTATLTGVTIFNNTAGPQGGAVVFLGDPNSGDSFTASYTIFAHRPASETCPASANDLTSSGHNIDVGTSCFTVPGTGDKTGVGDPGLANLANYGGLTATHALIAGSPALDAGASTCSALPTDQRGATSLRPFDGDGMNGAQCDIGAFEHLGGDPFPTTTTTTTTSTSTTTLACGDVNGDHHVDIGDALVVAQYDVSLRTCGVAPFGHPSACDVNSDGACNIGDALRMAQCDVGLVSCAFTCKPFSCP